ncbi:MAG: T9SS type A sorting domain-containing protein, partial [Bacteroidota bacterium]
NSYTTANTYTASYTDINGCDSIYTLNLTVNQPFHSIINAQICANSSYNWRGNTYTTTNTYNVSFTDINGCDSIYTLNLTVNNIDVSVNSNGATLSAISTAENFQWIDCNNGYSPILQATSQNFTATTNGNYAVILTQGQCSDTSTCFQIVITNNNRYESANKIEIIPNPANEKFFLDLGQIDRAFVSISDMTGKLIKIFQYNSNESVDISQLKEGIYLIKIQTDNLTEIKRLLIQR